MKILIAVDASAESREAVHAAHRFFGEDAEYHLISVGDSPAPFVGAYDAGMGATAADLAAFFDAAEQSAAWAAEEAKEQYPDVADIDVEVGHAGRLICQHGAEIGSDVVVIGSHDRGFWERIFDPSVGKYLIDHSPCPVLVVR